MHACARVRKRVSALSYRAIAASRAHGEVLRRLRAPFIHRMDLPLNQTRHQPVHVGRATGCVRHMARLIWGAVPSDVLLRPVAPPPHKQV
jgi:hypothetical protein